MNTEVRQFYIVLKPEHEAELFSKIVLNEYWHENRESAELNSPKDSLGVMRVVLELKFKLKE